MAVKKTYQQYYADIAKAIRNKGGSGTFTPAQMPGAIAALKVWGAGTIRTFPSSGGYQRYAVTDPANYTAIANAIRAKGVTGTFQPSQMAAVIHAFVDLVIIKFKYGISGMSNIYARNMDTEEIIYYSSAYGGIPVTPGEWMVRADVVGQEFAASHERIPEGTTGDWVIPFPYDS